MQTKEVHYTDDTYDVVVVVTQATVREGVKFSALSTQEQAVLEPLRSEVPSLEEIYEHYVRLRDFPAVVAATVSITNKDPKKRELKLPSTGEEFMALPQALVLLWTEAVWSLNPQWLPDLRVADDQGKGNEPRANSSSTSGSSRGSKQRKKPLTPRS